MNAPEATPVAYDAVVPIPCIGMTEVDNVEIDDGNRVWFLQQQYYHQQYQLLLRVLLQ
ncbi:hypothetical protein PR003_g9525 [Phytophthora rubi]|uniref:Uncharacterized protein n=1 Tax=Phytophthora rubi TaxID=129364 RepID=A0A6A4FG27_9STRA|nr:hypothetical protein PR002_g9653 [Phytophthora rubi]KAE9342340.1 hypothetical protein PR003_g9525 [Phytophthora rubi]